MPANPSEFPVDHRQGPAGRTVRRDEFFEPLLQSFKCLLLDGHVVGCAKRINVALDLPNDAALRFVVREQVMCLGVKQCREVAKRCYLCRARRAYFRGSHRQQKYQNPHAPGTALASTVALQILERDTLRPELAEN
jgi:hypothetical protein